MMSALLPLRRLLEQGGKFIQCIKHGVELSGLRDGPMRPPPSGLNPGEKRALEEVIGALKLEMRAIPEASQAVTGAAVETVRRGPR
jgi:4-hydroxy-tetrahydrodipicolinate synthase